MGGFLTLYSVAVKQCTLRWAWAAKRLFCLLWQTSTYTGSPFSNFPPGVQAELISGFHNNNKKKIVRTSEHKKFSWRQTWLKMNCLIFNFFFFLVVVVFLEFQIHSREWACLIFGKDICWNIHIVDFSHFRGLTHEHTFSSKTHHLSWREYSRILCPPLLFPISSFHYDNIWFTRDSLLQMDGSMLEFSFDTSRRLNRVLLLLNVFGLKN